MLALLLHWTWQLNSVPNYYNQIFTHCDQQADSGHNLLLWLVLSESTKIRLQPELSHQVLKFQSHEFKFDCINWHVKLIHFHKLITILMDFKWHCSWIVSQNLCARKALPLTHMFPCHRLFVQPPHQPSPSSSPKPPNEHKRTLCWPSTNIMAGHIRHLKSTWLTWRWGMRDYHKLSWMKIGWTFADKIQIWSIFHGWTLIYFEISSMKL
jgi:hypothetical protein